MKLETWEPDTCNCKVIENRDEITGEFLSLYSIERKCETHSSVPDAELYNIIFDKENKVKNRVEAILLEYEDIKDLMLIKTEFNPDGSSYRKFKEGIKYDWFFEGSGKNRSLNVRIKGAKLSLMQKKSIKDLCDKNFGLGKVKIL